MGKQENSLRNTAVYEIVVLNPKNRSRTLFQATDIDSLAEKMYNWGSNWNFKEYDSFEKAKAHAKKSSYLRKGRPLEKVSKKYADRKRTITTANILNAAKAAFRISAGKTASAEEIERRASICSGCSYLKKGPSGCAACGASAALAGMVSSVSRVFGRKVYASRRTANKYCGVCKCSLDLLTNLDKIELKNETEEENMRRPEKCWLRIDTNS